MSERKGFTLIELLIVVIILGALAAIAIPRFVAGSETAKITACKSNIDTLNRQIELYYAQTGSWPASLEWFINNCPNYMPDGMPRCPFGPAYNIDPTTQRVREHSH